MTPLLSRPYTRLSTALGLAAALGPAFLIGLRGAPPPQTVGSVVFSPDGSALATVSFVRSRPPLRELRVYDLTTGKERPGERRSFGASLLTVAPDGRSIRLDTPDGPRPVSELAHWTGRALCPGSAGMTAAVTRDGRTLVTTRIRDRVGDRDFGMKVWDVATGGLRGEMSDGEPLDAIAVSPDGKTLAGVRGRVAMFDLGSLRPRDTPAISAPACLPLAISPDGAVVAATLVGKIAFWGLDDGALRATIPGHADGLAFSPDGRWFAYSDGEDIVRVWDRSGSRPVSAFAGHVEPGHVLAVKQLAWGTGVNPLRFVTNTIWAVEFSPDGRSVASGDHNGVVHVWDAATGRGRLSLAHETPRVQAWLPAASWVWAVAWGAGWAVRARLAGGMAGRRSGRAAGESGRDPAPSPDSLRRRAGTGP